MECNYFRCLSYSHSKIQNKLLLFSHFIIHRMDKVGKRKRKHSLVVLFPAPQLIPRGHGNQMLTERREREELVMLLGSPLTALLLLE